MKDQLIKAFITISGKCQVELFFGRANLSSVSSDYL